MNKFLLIFCIFFSSFAYAQNNQTIENTTWRGMFNGREMEIKFLSDKTASNTYHNGREIVTFNTHIWSQIGNKISWQTNFREKKVSESFGEIVGDNLFGKSKHVNGSEWDFNFKLIAPNAPPFNPNRELAIEQNRLLVEQARANTTNSLPPTPNLQKANTLQSNSSVLETLSDNQINDEIIKRGMSQTDLDIFLTMYSFIWHANHYIEESPQALNNASLYGYNGIAIQRFLMPYKTNIKQSMDSYERVIDTISAKMGISSKKLKSSIGIVETIEKPYCRNWPGEACDPDVKRLSAYSKNSNRPDITSKGLSEGRQLFDEYHTNPGKEKEKNGNAHPGIEMHPSVFFQFYANFISNYYLQPQRLKNILEASNLLNQKILAQIEIEKENERKRQEFLNSPEGRKQIAAERERDRQKNLNNPKTSSATVFPGQRLDCNTNVNCNDKNDVIKKFSESWIKASCGRNKSCQDDCYEGLKSVLNNPPWLAENGTMRGPLGICNNAIARARR